MRHRIRGRKLNRSNSHRSALMANLATSLIEHERVVTTPQKAKEVRRLVDRLITLSKKGGLPERRRAISILKHKTITGLSQRGNLTSVDVTKKLFEVLAPRFQERNGGYTRIIRIGGTRKGDGPNTLEYHLNDEKRTLKLAGNRLGDNAEQVILEFVGTGHSEEVPEE
jgi:large subunit ribosomal protein L17